MKRMLALTSPHMTGDDVKYAQNLLKRAGYYKAGSGGEFGPLTAQATFRAKYWLGYAKPEQTFGTSLEKHLLGLTQPSPAMQKRIDRRKKLAQATPVREKALAQMEKLVGLVEEPPGSNHVPAINGWWGHGDGPWCAAQSRRRTSSPARRRSAAAGTTSTCRRSSATRAPAAPASPSRSSRSPAISSATTGTGRTSRPATTTSACSCRERRHGSGR